jgi:hypothetical protein
VSLAVALELVVRMQKIVAVSLACLSTMMVRLLTLVFSMLALSICIVISAPIVTAIVAALLRSDDTPRGEENARNQGIEGKSNDKTHGLAPVAEDLAIQLTSALVSSTATLRKPLEARAAS